MQTPSTKLKIWALLGLSALAAGTGRADYPSTVSGFGPVGYYRLNETKTVAANIAINSGTAGPLGNGFYANDVVGAEIHGVAAGALAAGTDGAMQSGPGYMQVPFDAAINPQGTFTAEIWVQPTTDPAGLTCPMAYGHLQNPAFAPNRSGWLLYQDNGNTAGGHGWQFRMYNHIGINRILTLSGGDVPTVGTWTHVVVSYDGTKGYMHVNGVLVASGNAPGYVANVDGDFSVGLRNDLAFPYAGLVDEVALYPVALSTEVINSHYLNGVNPSPATPYNTLVQASSPLLYYRLNEAIFTPTATLPTTANAGSWGATQAGNVQDNVALGKEGPTYAGFGAGNKAAQFNGVRGGISIDNPPMNTDTATITAWVKRRGVNDGSQGQGGGGFAAIVFQRGETAKATGLGFGDGNNDIRYHYEDAEFGFQITPKIQMPDQVWSFVAVSYSPTKTILCLNGVFSTNEVVHVAHDFSTEPLYIGLDPTGNRVVDGFIDEVAIFDKALTTVQLQQLFAAGQMPPVITAQPVGPTGTVYEGQDVSFAVTATGGIPLSYQWKKNGDNVSGQTQATFAKINLKAADTGNYTVVVSNPFGNLTSAPVALTVLAGPPIISQSPVGVSRFPGGTATFQAAAVGSTPITFQWLKDGFPIVGATGSSLTIRQLQAADAGNYSVVATNPNGSTPSAAVALTLLPVTPNSVAAILSRGPIAFYRLNESTGTTAFDSVGGLNGTYNGVTTKNGSAGPRPTAFKGLEADNNAYTFDGNTSDINCAPLNTTLTTATIIALIHPDVPVPTDLQGLVYSRGGGGQVGGLNLRTTTGSLGYNWNDAASANGWDSSLIPVTGQWNFVALVVEASQATMYLDSGTGLQNAVNAVDHGPQAFNAPTHLGTDPSGNRIFGGLMDEVAIFDHALTAAEIQAIRDAAYDNVYTPVAPSITVPPSSQTLFVGDSYTLNGSASGSQPLTYQWTKDGNNVPGAIRSSLSFNSLAKLDEGSYRLVVTQGGTSATSSPAVLTVLPIPTSVNLPDQLVLHLKFDGNNNDSSGRANNAAAVGAPGVIASGKLGGALHLNNANYLTVADANSDLQFAADTSFSVALWLKFSGAFNDLPIIGNAVNSTYQKGWVLSEDTGKFEWTLVDIETPAGQAIADPVGGPLINNGAWHNLVVVFNRATSVASSFVDGQSVGVNSIAGVGSLITGTTLTLGNDPTGTYAAGGSFDLDDVGVWRRALSAIEARSIYYAGQNGNSFDTTVSITPAISISGNVITFVGKLLSSDTVNGAYTEVSGATSPKTITATSGNKFFRAGN